jgi:hypothetical protein
MEEIQTGRSDIVSPAFAPVTARSPVAVIDHVDGQGLIATISNGATVPMRRAFSCLVVPQPGDRVLTAEADGVLYAIAVLERPATDQSLPMRIETTGDLELVARRISLRAGVLDVVSQSVTMMGDAFNALFRQSKRVIGHDSLVAKSTSLRTGERVSIVSGADVSQAGIASQTVDGPIAINSQTAVLSARSDIRLNGERINVG